MDTEDSTHRYSRVRSRRVSILIRQLVQPRSPVPPKEAQALGQTTAVGRLCSGHTQMVVSELTLFR